jgi:hypothetical protein
MIGCDVFVVVAQHVADAGDLLPGDLGSVWSLDSEVAGGQSKTARLSIAPFRGAG